MTAGLAPAVFFVSSAAVSESSKISNGSTSQIRDAGSAMDEQFWKDVERARLMTPGERASEGCRLRDLEIEQMLVDIKAEFPNASHDEAVQIRRERLIAESQRRSEEKHRIIKLIYGDRI